MYTDVSLSHLQKHTTGLLLSYAYLVWLVCPLKTTCLAINVIGNPQGVIAVLLGDSQDWVGLLLLDIILEARLQSEAIPLIP